MAIYTVDTDKRNVSMDSPVEAVCAARADVYLDPMREREHIERLEQTGRTAWAYGFSSVMISAQPQASLVQAQESLQQLDFKLRADGGEGLPPEACKIIDDALPV